jgi:hypothetical protein
MAAYYVDLAPQHFRSPVLDGFERELDAELGVAGDSALHLVAEWEGQVIGALAARLLPPEEGAERQLAPAWGRDRGATIAETWTYRPSPLSVPFWERRMAYEERSVNLRKRL